MECRDTVRLLRVDSGGYKFTLFLLLVSLECDGLCVFLLIFLLRIWLALHAPHDIQYYFHSLLISSHHRVMQWKTLLEEVVALHNKLILAIGMPL